MDDLEDVASLLLTPARGKDLMEPTPLLASSIVLCFVPAGSNRKQFGQYMNLTQQRAPEGEGVKFYIILMSQIKVSEQSY